MGLPKEWRDLIAEATRQGWQIELTGSNHLRWRSPEGKPVFSASTPSDHRAIKNIRSMLRRNGLRLDQ